ISAVRPDSVMVMVARGDLGVEIGDPELVGIQKALIRRARQLNRAVITATQMMESMITNPMPTRAEVMHPGKRAPWLQQFLKTG
ncbi:pyruvate kinase, partial [Escherichia sp. TWPC-MK]